MATATLDTLLVRLEADLGPLRRGLAQAGQQVQRSTQRIQSRFKQLGASISGVVARFATLRAGMIGAAVVAAGAAAKGIANVNAEFQDLQLTMNTVFGGMEQGEAAMDFITQFAQRTPFDIQTLSKAFIQLGGAGIKPTEELLTTFGDAASATTNRVAAFEAMVRIATRAVGGGLGLEELEQLVNQGIPVYQILQDEIGVTRTEISEMGQSAEGARKIMDALQTGLNKRFGGGMERASANLSVSMSNLGIAMTELIRGLGDGVGGFGLTSAFTFLSDTLTQVAVILKPVVQLIGGALAAAIYAVTAPLRLVTEGLLAVGRAALELIKWAGDLLPDSFVTLKEGIADLDKSLSELEASMNENIQPTEQIDEATQKYQETLQGLQDEYKVLQALAAGYSQAQIDAFKAAEMWNSLTFNNETQKLEGPNADVMGGAITDLIVRNRDLAEATRLAAEAEEEARETRQRFAETTQEWLAQFERGKAVLAGTSDSVIKADEIIKQFGLTTEEDKQLVYEWMESLAQLDEQLKAQAEAAEAAKTLTEDYNSALSDIQLQTDIYRMTLNGATEAEIEAFKARAALAGLDAERAAQLTEQITQMIALKAQVDLMNEAQAEANRLKEEEERRQETIAERMADIRFETENYVRQLQGMSAEKVRLIELDRELGGLTQKQKTDLEALMEAHDHYKQKLEEQEAVKQKFVDGLKQIETQISYSIADALVEGKGSMGDFMDFAKGFIKTLIAEFIRLYVIRKILSSIAGPLGFGASGGTVDTAAGGGRVAIPQFARGGTAGGGPMIVGERGPELFIPGSAGTIKNHHDTTSLLGKAGNPVVVNQTINIETGVAQTVRAEIATLLPTIKADTVKAVAEARRRGGSFAQAFGG